MKIKAVILLLFIQNFYLQAQEKQAAKVLDLTLMEARINQAVDEKKIPSMVIAVARDGKIIYEKAFGYADAVNEIKTTIHTPYQLASASKPFTATAIMMLYERNLINIDSPVTKYVPGLTLYKADPHFSTPTVRQVLNHTSGLGTYFDIGYADENYLFDNFENGWKRYGTIFLNLGTVSEYSNLGYGLLDHVIANVSGKTYNNFMASELFKPLQLDDTYITTPGRVTGTSARKYNADSAELPEVVNNTTGAGNIYTSVHDLVRFGIFHLREKNKGKAILSDSLIGLMHCYKDKNALYTINKNTFYGLGWYAQPGDGNSPVVWHEGGMPGASSMLKLFPKEGIAVAVITNTYNYPFCREITDEITNAIYRGVKPFQLMKWKHTSTIPPTHLSRVIGRVILSLKARISPPTYLLMIMK